MLRKLVQPTGWYVSRIVKYEGSSTYGPYKTKATAVLVMNTFSRDTWDKNPETDVLGYSIQYIITNEQYINPNYKD